MDVPEQSVIRWQKAEGAVICAVGIWLYAGAETVLPVWAAVLVFFALDLSFLGYLFGRRFGAVCYNLVHVYAFGAVTLALGHLWHAPLGWELGALWLAHCGFDRMLGYGLKTMQGFEFTHLGRIGRARNS
ncbi:MULTISPECIES: DUF4260 domain-containing protein [Tritonibacter]|uniref:DUF4260 domain-containing protein n=1 Tax=Tritonibacter scottomollicae TaxID=483013 RepID=A0A2T1AK30_TRISK|nr:DUF4260 domain-containing protein [Tritonibacter scottomollicae]PRZ48954.1 uncharacterized protein DUF4260 [Tritonibacter scottomollicae]WOI34873.1 DUF4260 domain-containing protein [Tritonibacter scottomollicae]